MKLGPADRLPSGQAATYSDPVGGEPDILIRDSEGRLAAFSAVCTHAGCTVGYEGGVIVCPCHGGEYSAETGRSATGPAGAEEVDRSGRADLRRPQLGGLPYVVSRTLFAPIVGSEAAGRVVG